MYMICRRDVIKSESASVEVPELELELTTGNNVTDDSSRTLDIH